MGGKGAMDCVNRLTVIGPERERRRFARHSDWDQVLHPVYLDLLEQSRDRHAWQFNTIQPPLDPLRELSRQWNELTFLLDYDQEDKRWRGLAKARAGTLNHHRIRY